MTVELVQTLINVSLKVYSASSVKMYKMFGLFVCVCRLRFKAELPEKLCEHG